MAARFLFIKITRPQKRISSRQENKFLSMLQNHHQNVFNTLCQSIPVFLLFVFLSSCQQNKQTTDQDANQNSSSTNNLIVETNDSLHQKLIDLEMEELFWKNRVSMSRDVSIDLVIDLVDSIMSLEIKGVPVRKTKISAYQISNSILYLKWYTAYKSWLASPFHLKQDSITTIPKEPVFIKDLSTTPLEAFDDWTYFTRLENERSIHYLLEFDRGLMIWIDQENDSVAVHDSLSRPELLGHWIKMVIPAPDAKAIYRALNTSSALALRY